MMVLAVAAVATTTPAWSQQDGDRPAQNLKDFIHYVLIARPDLAAVEAELVLNAGLSDAELALLIDDGPVDAERFDDAILRAMRLEELEPIAGQLTTRVEQGRLDLARDFDRIEEAIQMLTGNLRERRLAEERLKAAGEYAVPKLLNVIVTSNDQTLALRVEQALRNIGREAVYPLAVAVGQLGEPNAQRRVCMLLADIGWPHAQPYLRALAMNADAPAPVRQAAEQAYRRLGGVEAPLDDLYVSLARQYFEETVSLFAEPLAEVNNVWSYHAHGGLVPTSVPTDIFGEVRAMQLAADALAFDSSNRQGLALYVASNLRRENELTAGDADPVYGDTQYTPGFYATVFGTAVANDVLALALDSQNTPLVRDALAALARTTGGSNLFSVDGGRAPLLEALSYPDRRTQYDAALILGEALPDRSFSGDFAVVPLLASAVRTGNRLFAVVIADDDEMRRVQAGRLEDLGYTVIGADRSVNAVSGAMDQAVGLDLVVVHQDQPTETIQHLQNVAKTSVAPVLVVAPPAELSRLSRDFAPDARVRVVGPLASDDQFEAALDALLQRAAGGRMTDAEAEEYAIRALGTLHDIARSGSPAYSIIDAEPSLLDALATRSGGTRMLVAEILALIDSSTSQRALFDAAFDSTIEGEQIALLEHAADSVKRFGDMTEPRHINTLLDMVATASGESAEAAARVHGALNRPVSSAVHLVE